MKIDVRPRQPGRFRHESVDFEGPLFERDLGLHPEVEHRNRYTAVGYGPGDAARGVRNPVDATSGKISTIAAASMT